MSSVPQPSADRIVPFTGHPLVVGLAPGRSDLVVLTALSWAEALGVGIYFAYVDSTRTVIEELPGGEVRHMDIDPDIADDTWRDRDAELRRHLGELCAGRQVPWEFRYLAGRADRALTHLARAVDASAFVVGAHDVGNRVRARDFLDRSLSVRLSHHQHRPVLVVPVAVVDWRGKTPWE